GCFDEVRPQRVMTLVEELLTAADDESLPDNIRTLLRRAAAEFELDVEYLSLIREMNQAGQEPFTVNDALRDWLIAHGRLPFETLDEETETKGNA
ncbi:hypothetical protein, partial [Mesorhizobium marinum]|uniref:hypothetical protein n=1 Tax=Mesorhizobium marinum TaxID=3228790 RepID=UPI00346781A5